jgi:hypothetical protein
MQLSTFERAVMMFVEVFIDTVLLAVVGPGGTAMPDDISYEAEAGRLLRQHSAGAPQHGIMGMASPQGLPTFGYMGGGGAAPSGPGGGSSSFGIGHGHSGIGGTGIGGANPDQSACVSVNCWQDHGPQAVHSPLGLSVALNTCRSDLLQMLRA